MPSDTKIAVTGRVCAVCGKQHFGHCHKCPHDTEVKAGKYAGMDFAKVPCFGCRLPVENKVSGHGTLVPLDDQFFNVPQQQQDGITGDHIDAFTSLLKELWALPYITREIVARRIQGHGWEDIASTLNLKHNAGLTFQACHLRLKSAINISDSVRTLFAAMVIKQQKRSTDDE